MIEGLISQEDLILKMYPLNKYMKQNYMKQKKNETEMKNREIYNYSWRFQKPSLHNWQKKIG